MPAPSPLERFFKVDQLWTILPTICTGYWALLPLWPSYEDRGHGSFSAHMFPEGATHLAHDFSPRALLMLGLTVLWMLRSSYNTWRQGLFGLTDENYPWAVLRTELPTWLFRVAKLTFIVVIKNVLLLLIATPTLIAVMHPTPLTLTDGALAFVAVALLAWEFTADNQQHAYNAWKDSATGRVRGVCALARCTSRVDRGRRGAWAFWGVLNLMPILSLPSGALVLFPAGDSMLADALQSLVPLAPSLTLCLFFLFLTLFTESISARKYPWGYAAYSARVAMFVPVLTPLWGALLGSTDQKVEVEELVWGKGARETEALITFI
ncbi:DUF1295-domain-containing protein [Lactarius hengduanensis]|nr:DUF1295-domain-containing protein [Lactarius hengduanensis]